MSEERKGGGADIGGLLFKTACAFLIITVLLVLLVPAPLSPETKTLTILHIWEEGGQYYFADELGCVYLIGCRGDNGEIRYDDMPKIRFDKLEEGHRYNVEYVLIVYLTTQKNVRLSLGEEEMVR